MNKLPYIIKYSNHFVFNDRTLAFRKKCLFDITSGTPIFIPKDYLNGACYLINSKRLSVNKAKELVKMECFEVDVSHLQWNQQIELDECFNLEKI